MDKQKGKRQRKEQVNQAAEEKVEEITFTAKEVNGACNFNSFNPTEGNDERTLLQLACQ
jgi:hypothetical protein